MRMGFRRRTDQHDRQAVALVESIFASYGFLSFRMGVEVALCESAWLLRQSDPTSILLRFRPDRVHLRPNRRSVLCEIKSEAKARPNFAVEFDSWRAARMWNRSGRHVMLVGVDLVTRCAWACWVDSVPRPSRIFVPRRWDWERQMIRLAKEAPWARLKPVRYRSGSGTPYFLLPKTHPCWTPLPRFIERELLCAGSSGRGDRHGEKACTGHG